jgi:dimethylaniline monooxygenase (N-oxide forming)
MNPANDTPKQKRLAIVGAGSSGLIMLYRAKQELPDWEIIVYERSNTIVGCWGKPYPGFVSTSTKFTTQFASFPIFDASVVQDSGASRSEFFREGEYGEYLESFAETFGLREHVRFCTVVQHLQWDAPTATWKLTLVAEKTDEHQVESFDAIVLCTGLAAQPKENPLAIPCLTLAQLNEPGGVGKIRNSRVVVMGGGESAVDHACRLARSELNNTVFLSLQSGIRVSPRYHPIRGVPSDFLRNRLMLSINEHMRNWIGQRFVELRILYEERFRQLFPSTSPSNAIAQPASRIQRSSDGCSNNEVLRKEWAFRLTKSAKDELFNMFHNKSDDFLELVSLGKIQIIGAPVDSSARTFYEFQSEQQRELSPDFVVPSIGYRSTIDNLSDGKIKLADCYLGCVSLRFPNLFLVGFARPIIGNIPSISEMQASFVAGILRQSIRIPVDAQHEHMMDRKRLQTRFAKLNLDAIYPVEMFPYCDSLAKRIGCYPTRQSIGSFREWIGLQLAPATTLHYFLSNPQSKAATIGLPIYMPRLLILLLVMLKPIDWIFRGWWHLTNRMRKTTKSVLKL